MRHYPELSEEAKEVIIGSVLGDAHIRHLPGRAEAFMEVNHSIKAKDYVDWKWSVLKEIVRKKPKEREQKKHPRVAYRFVTRQHPFLTWVKENFYEGKRKKIPKGFSLTPRILAVWFMDDGSVTQKGDVYLNTQAFDLESQRRLLHALRELGIRARLNKDKKYYRIRIYKKSVPRLVEIVKEYIHPSMMYKLSRIQTP